jgi:hypothetical protein
MRIIPFLFSSALFFGCSPKDVGAPADGNGDSGSSGDDGAWVWTNYGHSTSRDFSDAYTDGATLYVTARSSSSDGGETWALVDMAWEQISFLADNNLNSLWGSGSGASLRMVAVGDDGCLADWDGETWDITADSSTNFLGVDGPTVNELMAVGGGGVWDNTGGEWARLQVDSDGHLNDIWFDGTTAVAVGNEGTIATYTEGEWTFSEHDSGADLHGVSGTNVNDVWAVGSDGTVLHWNGTVWQSIDVGTRANLWGVWSPSGNVAFVVGTNGEAYKIQGTLVEELPTGVREHLLGVTGTNEANVWAVGSKGMALKLNSD